MVLIVLVLPCMKVIVSKTRKKILSIKVCGDELFVVANNKLSAEEIKKIVESKRDWIFEQLKLQNRAVERETTSDANVGVQESNSDVADMFCGRKILLEGDVFSVRPSQESKCFLDGANVFVPEKHFANKIDRLKCLKSFLKKISAQNVAEDVSRFGCCASLCPTKIEFRQLSKGWVKCCSPADRVVTLDFRLCQLPEKLQHYVIVHAFSHFTNAGHDEQFWNTVSNYLPNYKSCVEELRRYDFLKEI